MGEMLIACSKENPELAIGAAVDVGDDFAAGLANSDAVIDFSHHSTCEAVLAGCVAEKKTIVIGTTGHTDAEVAAIHAAAKQIPIVFSGNIARSALTRSTVPPASLMATMFAQSFASRTQVSMAISTPQRPGML